MREEYAASPAQKKPCFGPSETLEAVESRFLGAIPSETLEAVEETLEAVESRFLGAIV